jgi:outer membrane protein OmpA-like peptidoglycan-associated protein
MKTLTPCFGALALALAISPAYAQLADCAKCKDPALFSRLPGFFLPEDSSVEEKEFDAVEFDVGKNEPLRVEGRVFKYSYIYDETKGPQPGFLRVMRNYQNAAARVGGKVVFQADYSTTIRILKDGRETWVGLSGSSNRADFSLIIVEKEQMKQDIVANAAALQSGLADAGHAEVPGIFFDTAKSDLKPESAAAVQEVANLLKQNAAMKVWVVGHTDNVGAAEANVTLSNARAAAVVQALVKLGIAPARLAPRGAGPFMPVASNKTEEGRARNRRVELVEQ